MKRSRGSFLKLGVLLLLAACSGVGREPSYAPIEKEQPLPLHGVTLAGPRGFCVDRASSDANADPAVVVFGNCAAISGNPFSEQPKKPALLTASVARLSAPEAAIGATMSAVDGFFRSEKGRAVLSRTGRAESVDVLESLAEDGAYYVRIEDRSPRAVPGADATYWRSYFDLGANVVSASAIGFERAPLSRDEGLKLLRDFRAASLGATGSAAVPVPASAVGGAMPLRPRPRPWATRGAATSASPPVTAPTLRPRERQPLKKIGIFRRLFM